MVAGRSLIEEKNHRPLCESNASTGFPGQRKTLSWQKKKPQNIKKWTTLSVPVASSSRIERTSRNENQNADTSTMKTTTTTRKKKNIRRRPRPSRPFPCDPRRCVFRWKRTKKKELMAFGHETFFFYPFRYRRSSVGVDIVSSVGITRPRP